MSKIQAFLRAFYMVRYIDDATRWSYWEVLRVLTILGRWRNTSLVAKEARALLARSHGSGDPESWCGGNVRTEHSERWRCVHKLLHMVDFILVVINSFVVALRYICFNLTVASDKGWPSPPYPVTRTNALKSEQDNSYSWLSTSAYPRLCLRGRSWRCCCRRSSSRRGWLLWMRVKRLMSGTWGWCTCKPRPNRHGQLKSARKPLITPCHSSLRVLVALSLF